MEFACEVATGTSHVIHKWTSFFSMRFFPLLSYGLILWRYAGMDDLKRKKIVDLSDTHHVCVDLRTVYTIYIRLQLAPKHDSSDSRFFRQLNWNCDKVSIHHVWAFRFFSFKLLRTFLCHFILFFQAITWTPWSTSSKLADAEWRPPWLSFLQFCF